jgi:hypothetical protein
VKNLVNNNLIQFIKKILIPLSSLVGIIYAFDMYIINRANTVVEPTKVKVDSIKEDVMEIKNRTRNIEKILMDNK